MSTPSSDYATCVQQLLNDIGYRSGPHPPYDPNYWGPFHDWIMLTLGPTSSWSVAQLAELEQSAGTVIERAYPYACIEMKLLFAKLTALAILIDDSIEDTTVYAEILQFSHRVYLGQDQQNEMLALYHANMKELSEFYGNDVVLRGLAITPWMTYIDACVMEQNILRSREHANHSRLSSIPSHDYLNAKPQSMLEGLALKFPHYLRSKSGIAEAYAAGIFKATRGQSPPLMKYIKVLPDLTFFIEVINDILSFHKEELAGETYNLIHLRTRALSSAGAEGNGIAGEWTPHDTLCLLCDEIREAVRRIDGLLRLEECERKTGGATGRDDFDEVDLEIAKQWRGWRDGYISWHFECRRYKLDFLKLAVCADSPTARM
ncbi:isoprenoid synthase domain-containing protein [Mycena vulgaris]|nr:isoprenoid synthase domain-containing protein [Mycena vulgaris]